jgi:hypothetical protein
MKSTLIRFSLLLFIGAFVMSSCKDNNNDDDDDNNPPPTVTADFKAKVDDVQFEGKFISAKIDKNNNLIIYSYDDQDAEITLGMLNFDGEGTYELSPSSQNGATYDSDTSVTGYYTTFGENGNGNIIITKWEDSDSLISGTFSFDAQYISSTSIVTVTDGVFNNLIIDFVGEHHPVDTSFTAKVDGVDYEGNFKIGQIDQNNNLRLFSVDALNAGITLGIKNFNGVGTYQLTPNSQNGAVYTPDTTGEFFYTTFGPNGNGSIIVTMWDESDSLISGTFSFNAQHIVNSTTVSVTEGVFNNISVRFFVDEVPEGNNTFSVKINGDLWAQDGGAVSGFANADKLLITAANTADQSSFVVTMPGNVEVGLHSLGVGPDYLIIYTANSSSFLSVSGTINVTEHDPINNHIKATFNFVGMDNNANSKNFTDGKFEVDYQ